MVSNAHPPLSTPAFLRLWDILGCKKRGIQPLIPIGHSTWWRGIANGEIPKPVKLGKRAVAWRRDDINALIEKWSQHRPEGEGR